MERQTNCFQYDKSTAASAEKKATVKTVILAEDAALARLKIESIIVDENVPIENWIDTVGDVLKNNPQLKDYWGYFKMAIKIGLTLNNNIGELWKESAKNEVVESEDKQCGMNSREIADEESSNKIFENLFKKKPNGSAKVIKDKINLILEINKPDLNSVAEADYEGLEGCLAYGKDENIPTIVVLPDSRNKPINLEHEFQHLRNDLFGLAMKIAFKYESFPNLSKELQKTNKRRSYEESSGAIMEAKCFAKTEILAYAASYFGENNLSHFLKNIPDFSLRSGLKQSDEIVLMKFKEQIWKALAENPTEALKKTNDSEDKLSQGEREKINEAMDSYFHLTEIYEKAFPGRANRMAVDVLVQFPLDKWTSVVRLIKTRRNSNLNE